MTNKKIYYQDIGLTSYNKAFDIQTTLFEKLKQIKIKNKYSNNKVVTDNYFLLTEHPHVYTLGKSGKEEHLLIDEQQRKEKSVQFIKTNRGGDITYHGPGQIVGYPIIDLDNFNLDILAYIRILEEIFIDLLEIYNLQGERSEGETGVWLDVGKTSARKICAIGVKTSRWVTMHGFALNIDSDLSYFDHIIPCGIRNKGVTSLQKELGYTPNKNILKQHIINLFAEKFKAYLLPKKIHPAYL